MELLKQYQNRDPVIRQLKSWHKYKTKHVKADTTILGKKHSSDISENLITRQLMKIQIF